jgi:hypothetical protein
MTGLGRFQPLEPADSVSVNDCYRRDRTFKVRLVSKRTVSRKLWPNHAPVFKTQDGPLDGLTFFCD